MNLKNKLAYGLATATSVALYAPLAFAEGTSAVTSSQMTAITDDLTATINTIFPSLLGLLALMLGVTLVPKLVKRFMR